MADYDVTAPDGRQFVVTAPDGATQDQVLAYAKDQFAKMPPKEPGTLDKAGMALKAASMLSPAGVVAEGMKLQNTMAEKYGYAAGGKVTDITGSPEAGFGTNVAVQMIPALVGGGGAAKLAKPVMETAASGLMRTAVKASPGDHVSGDAAKAVETLLNEGINVTRGGMTELRKRVGDLYKQAAEKIANSKGMVSAEDAANAHRAYERFEYAVLNRDANLATIKATTDDFLKTVRALDPLSEYSGSIPVQLAQKLKQGTQRQLSDSYGELSGPLYEAGKDIAFGLRKGIEKAEPSVGAINSRIAELLNALSVTERHALMALNKNTGGLAFLASDPKAAAGFMLDRSELFKSIAARMLHKSSEVAPASVVGTGIMANQLSNQQTQQ